MRGDTAILATAAAADSADAGAHEEDRREWGRGGTGCGMETDARERTDGGFDNHLIKPVDLNGLDSLIQQANSTSVESIPV